MVYLIFDMKREEKNQITKRKIVDSALREHSKNGSTGWA